MQPAACREAMNGDIDDEDGPDVTVEASPGVIKALEALPFPK